MMIVGGLFANTDRLEPYWIWLNYISFPRYAYKGFMVNEFSHIGELCINGNSTCRYLSGSEVLEVDGFTKDTDTVWFSCVMLLLIMVAFRVLGAFALWFQGKNARSELVFEGNFKRTAKSSHDPATIEMQ